jgi:UDP-3-O-[3-hydroxymyristoyl] glucosamine N-acyltransferase
LEKSKVKRVYKLSQLAELVSGRIKGEDVKVLGINAIPLANEKELVFVDSLSRLESAKKSKAQALVVKEGLIEELPGKSLLIVPDVRLAIAKISSLFVEKGFPFGISDKAYVDPSAEVEDGVCIMPFSYIGREVKIKKGVVIHSFCYIGDGCEIGEDTILYPHVVLYPGTIIGKRCIIHAGVVLGACGFGYAQEPKEGGFVNVKIYHFGRVRVEDDVEIGANSCVDRATFGETVIGTNTKIDNLVQVGHNVRVGRSCILVAQVGIGGSAEIGDYTMLGGQVGIAPGSKIGKFVKIAAKSGVVGKIEDGEEVAGIPAIKASIWRKAVVIFSKLPELYQRLKNL